MKKGIKQLMTRKFDIFEIILQNMQILRHLNFPPFEFSAISFAAIFKSRLRNLRLEYFKLFDTSVFDVQPVAFDFNHA